MALEEKKCFEVSSFLGAIPPPRSAIVTRIMSPALTMLTVTGGRQSKSQCVSAVALNNQQRLWIYFVKQPVSLPERILEYLEEDEIIMTRYVGEDTVGVVLYDNLWSVHVLLLTEVSSIVKSSLYIFHKIIRRINTRGVVNFLGPPWFVNVDQNINGEIPVENLPQNWLQSYYIFLVVHHTRGQQGVGDHLGSSTKPNASSDKNFQKISF